MSFRISRLHRGEWIVLAGSIVLLVSLFALPWYGIVQTLDGWNGIIHFRWLAVVTLAFSFALVILQATRRAPAVPVALAVLTSILGAVTCAWLIYRFAISPPPARKAGGWIGLAGALAITYGAGSSMRREGIEPQDGPAAIPTIDPSRARS